MPRRLPPLNALRAFEAAGRLGSFTLAAQELYVTHGAVSRQVQALEAWLGVTLFERYNRRLELTAAGRTYLDEVSAALERVASATARLEARRQPHALTVNASSTFTLCWLLPRLADFRIRHPEVEVQLVTSTAPLTVREVGSGVAIRNGPQEWPGLTARPFLSSACSPVCSPALRKRVRLSSAADLARHTLLHARSTPDAWPHWLRAAGVRSLAPAGELHFDHLSFALQAAVDGLGVAMGPLPLVTAELAAGRLVLPFPERLVPAEDFYVLHAAGTPVSAAQGAFCEWLLVEGRKGVEVPRAARSARR